MDRAIYDESFRTLAEQAKVLEGLRSRATAVAAIANVATAFIGGLALSAENDTGLGSLEWLAIGLFCLAPGASLGVLVPSTTLVFWHHPHGLLGEYLGSSPLPTLSEFRRSLAYVNGRHFERNDVHLRRLTMLLWSATISLTVEVVLWLVILAL